MNASRSRRGNHKIPRRLKDARWPELLPERDVKLATRSPSAYQSRHYNSLPFRHAFIIR